jgi:DNA-binding transcriptional LysR family regulator
MKTASQDSKLTPRYASVQLIVKMTIILAGDGGVMEIRQLEIFRALAQELHFTKAAARVHCVQSNVTTQIRALENELGARLFDRLAKRVVLTDAGLRFLPYAERVLATLEEGRVSVGQNTTPSGPLRIGTPESVLTYRLPRILARFRKLYPKVELIFRPYLDQGLVHLIESGELDLAVWMGDTIQQRRLRTLSLRNEKLVFIAAPKHPLTAKKRVTPHDLTGQTLLLTEAGCSYRRKLDQLLSIMSVRPESITEFSSVEAIKECVSLGMGLGLLPEIVVARELALKQVVALAWTGSDMDMATYVVWHKDKWISPALGAFISLLEQMLKAPASASRSRANADCGPKAA